MCATDHGLSSGKVPYRTSKTTQKTREKNSLRIVCFRANDWTPDLPHTKQ